jgi:hypothetical protein
MMKYLRPYRLVILIVLPVIVLVLIRALAPGSFKPDAGKRAEASFTGANLLNRDQVAALGGKPLIVKLGNGIAEQKISSSDTLYIEADRLLEKRNLKAIQGHKGAVILVSGNPAIAAKAWMILSQMGYRDLYILTENAGAEVLKYKFRPDSAAGI